MVSDHAVVENEKSDKIFVVCKFTSYLLLSLTARGAPYAKSRTQTTHDIQMSRHHNYGYARTAAENGPSLLSWLINHHLRKHVQFCFLELDLRLNMSPKTWWLIQLMCTFVDSFVQLSWRNWVETPKHPSLGSSNATKTEKQCIFFWILWFHSGKGML